MNILNRNTTCDICGRSSFQFKAFTKMRFRKKKPKGEFEFLSNPDFIEIWTCEADRQLLSILKKEYSKLPPIKLVEKAKELRAINSFEDKS